jgi:cytochrome c-type biogenesis protein CcmH/NrfG
MDLPGARGTGGATRGAARTALAAALTVAAVAVAHGAAVHNDFVTLDDGDYIYENAHVRSGLSLESATWAFRVRQEHTYFHPVTWLSLMAEADLFGVAPRAFHAVSVALHAASAVLLLLVLAAGTGRLWPSWLAATLWAVHPLTVEAVAWASERKAVLSTALALAAMLAYVRHARSPSRRRLAPVLALGVLAALAKPALVVLPALLLVLDGWPLGRVGLGWRKLVAEKLPLAAAAAAVLAIAVASARHFDTGEVLPPPLRERALNALATIPSYLGASAWPARLAVFRPFPAATSPLVAAAGAAAVVACTALAFALRRRSPAVPAGWAWFVVALGPYLGLVQSGLWPSWADRFAYLALAGLAIAAAFGAADLAGAARVPRLARVACALAVVAALVLVTRGQVAVWKTSRTLYEHAVKVVPGAAAMHYNLACVEIAEGRLAEARRSLEAALAIEPLVARARAQLGAVLQAQGDLDGAGRELGEALRLDPRHVEALYNYATVLVTLHRGGEARPVFRRFLEVAPAEYAEQRRDAEAFLVR